MKLIFTLLTFLIILNPAFADTNGIWSFVEDLTGTTFGLDEKTSNSNFTFINPVYFLNSEVIIGSSNQNSTLRVFGEVDINSNVLKNLKEPINSQDAATKSYVDNKLASSFTQPPVCTGNNALQWTGSSWSCNEFLPARSNECSYSGQTICSGSNVRTCGNFDSDSCLEYNSGTSCSNGCSGGACISCTSRASYSCSSGNVWWYNSCGQRESVKESCSNGCSGSSCSSLNWYQQHYGTFSKSPLSSGNTNSLSITVSNTGSLSGTGWEKYYIYDWGGYRCVYSEVLSGDSVKLEANSESTSNCFSNTVTHRPGKVLTKSEALAINGVNFYHNSFSISGSMSASGSFSGTWTSGSVSKPFSGTGSSSGSSLYVSYLDASNIGRSVTLS